MNICNNETLFSLLMNANFISSSKGDNFNVVKRVETLESHLQPSQQRLTQFIPQAPFLIATRRKLIYEFLLTL